MPGAGANQPRATRIGFRLIPAWYLDHKREPQKRELAMANRMSVEKRNLILRLLVEGNSVRSVTRIVGTNIPSVLRQLAWAGEHCRQLMDASFRGLRLRHLEVDEIWTFCHKKQAQLTTEEKATRHDIGDVYLWTCLDQDTRLIPSFVIGKRSADNARRLMMDLAIRLVMPNAHATDAHAYRAEQAYRPVVQISTDGFAAYPEAVDLAFGPYVKYGTIVKQYRNAALPYSPSEMVGTERRGRKNIGEGEARTICTSHVERNNLTIRTFMKRFTRLALGFSKKLDNLQAAVNLHMAYYNFCWRPGDLRVSPAMAAGVVGKLWTLDSMLAA
jgi:IS1 family transposase